MIEWSIAVALFTGIVTLLSLCIVAARSVLVVTGSVAVMINENRSVQLDLGKKLLFALADNQIFLPSACGGKGTCGQCRVTVLEGGGQMLATEKAHITPLQASRNERLACQLSVRNAMRLRVAAEVLGIRQLECTVRSNDNVATFIKELVLDLPTGCSFEFRAGSYVQVHAPPFAVSFTDFQVPDQFRPDWDHIGLWQLKAASAQEETRAYSLANSPLESDELKLNVRIATPPGGAGDDVPPGLVSSFLFSLKENEKVNVTGPFGEFCAKQTQNEMVFIGGGAGMAPLRSIIVDQLKRQQTHRKMSFWYGARSLGELFYRDLFDRLQREHDNFTWHVALSDPLSSDRWDGPVGFIHQVVFDELLSSHPDPETCEFYICGPPLMSGAVIDMLRNLGVDDDRIAMDDFGGTPPVVAKSMHQHGG